MNTNQPLGTKVIFNQELVPTKAIDIFNHIAECEGISINGIYFVTELYKTNKNEEPFGKYYTEINAMAVNIGMIIANAVGIAEEENNCTNFKAIIWLDILATMLHEAKHAMQLKNNELLDDEEADAWAIERLFFYAKYINIEMPYEWDDFIQRRIDIFSQTLHKFHKEPWAKTQIRALEGNFVEFNIKNNVGVPTMKKLAQLHFNSEDPAWEDPYPEDMPNEQQPLPNTDITTTNVEHQSNPVPEDYSYTPYSGDPYNYEAPIDPPINTTNQQLHNNQQLATNTAAIATVTPEEVKNNPLVMLLLRMHNHIYTKCGWNPAQNPKAGFSAAANIAENIFIGDLDLQDKIAFYDGTTPIGTIQKGVKIETTLNGFINQIGQPCYRIALSDGTNRLIKPVLPDPSKTWGQQAITGAQRLMVFNEGKMTSVIEQAPGKEAGFRQC